MDDEAAFAKQLARCRELHPKARHHCWAWRLPQAYRFQDDGEPGGTAGRPILQVLEGKSLFYAGVIVVRYFGGVKLGTGGLVRAYSGAAQRAVEAAGVRFREQQASFQVQLSFARLAVRQELESLFADLQWLQDEFTEQGWCGRGRIPCGQKTKLQAFLQDRGGGGLSFRWLEDMEI
ncbi:MAG: YigZ family protein [Planctomycetota bacterium]|nr:MAG: YigZ family protein [Planctomycetota bacterium]